MAFPDTVLPVVTQWYVGGAWTTVERDGGGAPEFGGDRDPGVEITGGRTNETRETDAGRASATWDNTGGRFAPDNPHGEHFGLFGPGTRVRYGVTAPSTWLAFSGPAQGSEGQTSSAGARVTTPDSAGLSITGDLDVRLDADLDTWVPRENAGVDLVGKWTGTAGQKSWQLVLQISTDAGGYLGFYWSNDGTAELGSICDVPVPITTGRLSVRATIDVNNGAAGRTISYYYSTDTDLATAAWTLLDTDVQAGTTSIFDSTTEVTIGDTATGSQDRVIRGRWYSVEIRNGIAGSLVADVDFTAQTAGASSFSDGTNTWTLTGDVALTATDWRHAGEVPSWLPRRDTSGNDNYLPITSHGALRRLGIADSSAVQSAMRRTLSARDDTFAYWPLEDGRDSTRFGSALTGGLPMGWAEATPNLAADDQFLCSASLPQSNGARYTGFIPFYEHTGVINFQWLMYVPAATTDNRMLVRLTTLTSRWDIVYGDVGSGSLQLEWYDSTGTLISETAFITFGVDDQLVWCSLELTQNGADVDYKLALLEVGAALGTSSSGTAAGVTMGRATAWRTGHTGHDPAEVFGHFIGNTSIRSIYDVYEQLNAYIGETAGRRLERLAAENGTQFLWRGDLDSTVEMGAQGIATLLDLARECALTDGGILFEPRDQLGLGYRTRESLTRQAPLITLDHAGGDLSFYDPAIADTAAANRVTVRRGGTGSPVRGGDWTEVAPTGPRSILDPPDGLGLGYDAAYTINCTSDTDLPHHASWLLHLGTTPGVRLERFGVLLQRSPFTDARRAAVRRVEVGDVVEVTNPPAELGAPDDVRQVVQGYREVLSNFGHLVEWTGSPGAAYDVAVFDDPDMGAAGELARYSSNGTVLAVPLASAAVDFAGSQTLTAPDAAYVGADLDVRVLVAFDDWTPAGESIVAAHYVNSGNQRRWAFGLQTGSTGRPTIYYSTDGSTNTQVTCSAATGFTDGTPHWIRVTIDVDNGAAGRDVRFWTSADGVTWTQLGTTTTTAGTITLFDSAALFQLGARSGTSLTSSMSGVVYGVQVSGTIRTTTLSDGDSIVPFDPADWTAGYAGTGTGAAVADQTTALVSLSTPSGPLWTTDAAGESFPFNGKLIAERVSVTDIDAAGTGTSSRVQVATVTRGANGVVHAYPAGTEFGLWRPVYWGL